MDCRRRARSQLRWRILLLRRFHGCLLSALPRREPLARYSAIQGALARGFFCPTTLLSNISTLPNPAAQRGQNGRRSGVIFGGRLTFDRIKSHCRPPLAATNHHVVNRRLRNRSNDVWPRKTRSAASKTDRHCVIKHRRNCVRAPIPRKFTVGSRATPMVNFAETLRVSCVLRHLKGPP
jgi:hypothetical protein